MYTKLVIRSTLLATLLAGCFAAQAMRSPGEDDVASAEDIEQLAAWVSACPELTPLVAQTLDTELGILSERSFTALEQEALSCLSQRESLTTPDRYRLAYSSLKSAVGRQLALYGS